MMQIWGSTHVSSPLEVYIVLSNPPRDAEMYGLWRCLLDIEPPVWGAEAAKSRASAMSAAGFRVWTWDDVNVVVSVYDDIPPRGVLYTAWYELDVVWTTREVRSS